MLSNVSLTEMPDRVPRVHGRRSFIRTALINLLTKEPDAGLSKEDEMALRWLLDYLEVHTVQEVENLFTKKGEL